MKYALLIIVFAGIIAIACTAERNATPPGSTAGGTVDAGDNSGTLTNPTESPPIATSPNDSVGLTNMDPGINQSDETTGSVDIAVNDSEDTLTNW